MVLGQVEGQARPRLPATAAGFGVIHAYAVIGDDPSKAVEEPEGYPGLIRDHKELLAIHGVRTNPWL